ncbi:uncharacterized protein LOC110604664 isoform X2 [Manihot esculenta]|uniref:uncharacterized protein LOC110604664 isoform X2 n=1 Tax=Manihot esculenta TaxID=3983 RepID=UPI000B5D8CEF|nr:uncharacterized protein LOC110604664 isoform X2 [Manihot esculenta]
MESFESNLIKDAHQIDNPHITNNADHGWQKVTYAKRQRKQKQVDSASSAANAVNVNGTVVPKDKSNVFRSLEQQSEERRRRIIESQRAAIAAVEAPVRSKHRSDDEDEDEEDSDDAALPKGNEKVEEKKVKQKKPKKPQVTLAEAAAKIDSADLAAFLADISASYEGQQDILLMRFADYFGRAFSAVSSAQFPWVKLFRENTVSKMIDVAIFVVLAMVLRRKPDALLNVLPTLRESSKYKGQDKLPVVAWMIAQVSQGDLTVGLYSWAHNLLPIVSGKSSNPQSRDIILQLAEKILSYPKARTILVSGAVRKGERLVPPFALEMLLRVTFPLPSATVKATERILAVYPTLREVALAGSTGSKAMKQVALQLLSFAIKAAGESNPELSKEAAGICIWCLTQNNECYKLWDKVYQENLEASIAILKKMSEEWKEVSVKLAPLDTLSVTVKNFRQKNEKALANGEDAARQSFYRDADKYCKLILGKLSRGHYCTKSMAFAVIAVAVGAAFLSPDMESLDWKKLVVVVNSQFSS